MWWTIAIVSAVVSAVWLGILFEQRRVRTERLRLEPSPARDGAWPPVCAVLPVRNAAAALRQCVESLRRQEYPNLSIVIVDDRSDDETPVVAAELARDDDRIRVVRIDELPPGWLGKSHALTVGSRTADAEWLLYVDDDCVLHPAAVTTAVAEARQRGVELLSLWPRHDGRTFWERLLIPLCGGIIALWFARAQGRDEGGFANGQFLLVSRSAYGRIGGHEAVRNALIEDVALAAKARDSGVRSFVGSGSALFSVRMYDGFRAVFEGWSRIFVGAIHSPVKLLLSTLWLAAGSLLPYVVIPLLATHMATEGRLQPSQVAALSLSVQHLLLQVTASYRFWGLGGCDRRYLWLYPVAVVVVMAMLVRALYVLIIRRRVRWRTTTYAIDRRANIAWSE